jgi:hypothetical protein
VKSTFLLEPDSDGTVVLLFLGVPPAEVSFVGDPIAWLVALRDGRNMDFRPWKVGSLEVKLGLLGLEAIDGTAGSGLEVVAIVEDPVG